MLCEMEMLKVGMCIELHVIYYYNILQKLIDIYYNTVLLLITRRYKKSHSMQLQLQSRNAVYKKYVFHRTAESHIE